MSESAKSVLPTMDESLFCRLLEGPGTVQVDIVMLEQYFLPFVSFRADSEAPPVPYGAIVRGRSDLLAAQTVAELVMLLRDIAGESASLEIHPAEHLNGAVGNSADLPRRTVPSWFW
jgi:hypothetical protein